MPISHSTLTGAAGEHHVMAQLLRRGFVAALAPAGVPTADIIVTDPEGQMTAAVQVKTRLETGGDGGWHMRPKHEKIIGDRLFYVFVNLTDAPDCFILSSADVAEAICKTHRMWLSKPGAKGQQRRDSDVRRLLPSYDKMAGPEAGYPPGWLEPYRDNWELLRR